MMPYDVVEARHVGGFVILLRFRDNTAGEIDLASELHGAMFEPLREPSLFSQFQIHPEFHTLTGRTARILIRPPCTTGRLTRRR